MFTRSQLRGAVFVAAAATVAPALGCRSTAEPRAEAARPAEGQAAPRDVQLERAVPNPLTTALELSGSLAAHERVTLATQVPGRVASIDVDLASPVKRGQLLARIDSTDYALGVERAEAAVAQVKAQLGLAGPADPKALDVDETTFVRRARASFDEERANVGRLSALVSSGLAPEADLETARAALLRAEAGLQSARDDVRLRLAQLRERQSDLAIARQRLADSGIRSPLDGFVLTRWADTGEYLAAGAPVLELVDVDPLRLRLALPEREAARVKTGQVVEVVADHASENSGPQRGVVTRIAPSLDPATRTLLVEADIPNPGDLRPGNFVRARIELGQREALTVPETSVVTFAGLQKLVLVHEGRAVERNVTTGQVQGGRVEITSGLAAGEAYVLAPLGLQQGQPVRVSAGP